MENKKNTLVWKIIGTIAFIIIIVFIIGNFKNTNTNTNNYSSSIKIEFLSDQKLNIINDKFTIFLYGYDMSLMDFPATLITQKAYNIKSIPTTIILPYPDNATDLIMKHNGSSSVVKESYYVSIEWDNNGDGTPNDKEIVTPGDISIDWDNPKSQDNEIELVNGAEYKVYLREVE